MLRTRAIYKSKLHDIQIDFCSTNIYTSCQKFYQPKLRKTWNLPVTNAVEYEDILYQY